ncbi:hypothetical protein TWF730_000595 [Orbilia blumenaviensis]|uniref:Restriction of telomere capping protein 4 n=1 Tax=Orbilia blumenaviensis TaxID=1796055 RepID=A0AAV9VM83_9PEZI
MYSGRTTRSSNGRSDVNKPFKSPVIPKPTEKSNQLAGLLEDSDDDDDDISDNDYDIVDLSRSPQKISTAQKPTSSLTLSSTLETQPTNEVLLEDDEVEVVEVKEEKVFRSTSVPGKKGKFATRQQREQTQNLERRKAEREEIVVTETKKKGLRIPECVPSLLESIEKYDPIKIAKESPKKTPKKTPMKNIEEMRARYNFVLKKNGLDLDPKLQSLLEEKLDHEEPSFDLDSDSGSNSGSSASSTSSRKRKREASDPETTPKKKTETSNSKKQTKRAKAGPKKYVCPMCNEEVPQQLYESYLPDLEKKYKIELRRKFHKSHKLDKIHAKAKELNIPDIDWDGLEDRCTKYFPYLSDIMARKTKSHFRDISEKFNKTKRNNKKSRTEAIFDEGNWELTYPGYYGPRGSEIMGDAISGSKLINEALKNLRKAKDITTTGGGAGSYIQSILVPELGTRLIMEDFKMTEDEIEKGRKLMQETIDIGMLLNHGEDNDADLMGINDGMEWWWKEQEAKQQQDEETELSQSQASIYINPSDEE